MDRTIGAGRVVSLGLELALLEHCLKFVAELVYGRMSVLTIEDLSVERLDECFRKRTSLARSNSLLI